MQVTTKQTGYKRCKNYCAILSNGSMGIKCETELGRAKKSEDHRSGSVISCRAVNKHDA